MRIVFLKERGPQVREMLLMRYHVKKREIICMEVKEMRERVGERLVLVV